jgi:hypothetical protein
MTPKAASGEEMTQTVDVSRTGVTLRLSRRVRHGNVLYLTLPLPVKLRSHGYSDSSFKVYSLVRRVETAKKGMRVVALEFLGERSPAGYRENRGLYLRPEDGPGMSAGGSRVRNCLSKSRSNTSMIPCP